MMRATVGPAWALALAGILAIAAHPDAATAQRGPSVRSIDVTPPEAQITVGQTQVFLFTAYDRANNILTATFRYSSSNAAVATVDANGTAVGVGPGTAIITATVGQGSTAKTQHATLTVTGTAGAIVPQATALPAPSTPVPAPAAPAPVAARPAPTAMRPGASGFAALEHQPAGIGVAISLRIRPLQPTLVKGERLTLEYRALNENGDPAVPVPLQFEVDSAGRRMAEVDSVGVVKALGDTGTATVRITVPNNPNVTPRTVPVIVKGDSVRFSNGEYWLPVGTVDTLHLIVPAQQRRPFNGPPGTFQFESSDEAKVTVNSVTGIFTASAPGNATITGSGSAYYHPVVMVHVVRPVASFAATPAESALTIAMNTNQPVTVRALAADGSPITETPLHWTLPDTAFARFDTATHILRGAHIGETRLAVSAPVSRDSNLTRTWRIRVVAGGLSVSRVRVGVGTGDRTPLTVQFLDERHRPVGPATDLRWSSTADSVARFVDGEVQGLKPGHARLTARAPWDSLVTVDVFVSGPLVAPLQRAGRYDLFTFGVDSVPRFVPLTADAAIEMEPAWSPDLTRIAFVAPPLDRPTNAELYVANADGSEPRRLTFDSATIRSPAFVWPAGEQILYQSNKGGTQQIYVINRDGTGRRALTTTQDPNSQPEASPDGRKILFVSLRKMPGTSRNYDIWEMNVDGTGERRVTTSPRPEDTPRYAADGRAFYYLREESGSPASKRIYRQSVTDSTGATATAVTPLGMFVQDFTISPDGNLFVLMVRENVRGQGEVSRAVFYNPVTQGTVPVRLGTGEQLFDPVFRPATPQPR